MVVLAELVLYLIKAIVMSWDAITGWAYRLVYRSDKRVKNFNKVRAWYVIKNSIG
jgi:hypothetical protein